jgi:predicted metal-dependent enzyme (double-stranded beta helix superfamily)
VRLRTVHQVVEDLLRLEPNGIDPDAVSAIVGDGALDEASLRPFVAPRTDRYARHLVHRSRWFDVLVLTWLPGQLTPIHNHAGNLGWVRLVRGRIAEETYRLVPSTSTAGLDVAPDLVQPRRGIALAATGRAVVADAGAVATVDRQRAVHRLGNPREHAGDETAVTLHVYSKPHDVCLVFDPDAGTCTRREMAFDNAAPKQP